MIYLMEMRDGALADRFRRHRRALGLDPATPYFNAGLMVVDRAAWRAAELGERATRALRDAPRDSPSWSRTRSTPTLAGGFAPLSPRCNFMGDFFLSVSRRRSRRSCCISSTCRSHGNTRLARRGALRRSLPKLVRRFALAGLVGAGPAGRARKPLRTAARRRFAERLVAFLAEQRFVDD